MFGNITSKFTDIIGSLIHLIFKSIMAPFADVYTLDELIFGTFSKDAYWGTFTATELEMGFLPIYNLFLTIAFSLLALFIVVAGMRIARSGSNPTRRNELYSFVSELLFVGLGLIYLPEFYSLLMSINHSFISIFNNDSLKDVFEIDTGYDDSSKLSSDTGFIGKLIIELVIFGLGLWANFYYLMRKLTLIVLFGLGPLMLVFWMVPQFKGITLSWLKELIGTIFIQTIHAFVFYIVAVISITESNSGAGLIGAVIVYMLFIPIGEQIRGLLGMGGNMTGALNKAGSMMGMSALSGIAGSLKGAFDGQSVMGALGSMKNGGKGVVQDLKDGKGIGGAMKGLGNAAKEGFQNAKNSGMLNAGDVLSKGGRAVAGMAGTFAGSPMGPIGAIAGASIGSAVGGAVGGLTGRVGAVVGSKIGDRIKGGASAVSDLKKARDEESADEKVVTAAAVAQASSWASSNKENVMKDLKQQFPTASQQELDQKFDAMVADKKNSYVEQTKKDWSNAKGMNSMKEMFGKGGVPNTNLIANNLAAAKVNSEKSQFMVDQLDGGATKDQAAAAWRNEAPKRMSNYAASFNTPQMENDLKGAYVPKEGAVASAMQNVGAFVGGAYGKDVQAVKQGAQLLKSAVGVGAATFAQNVSQGNVISALPNAVKAANMNTVAQMVENAGGDAVQLQDKLMHSAGTVGGMLLGKTGLVKGQQMMNAITNKSGIGNYAQAQVSSASEIMAMAHKVPDQNGNMMIAPGAVQHVTTRDGSYVQVRTSSGETRTVSQIGAGNETLGKGQTVYQDLTSTDGGRSLEVAPVGKSGSSTYVTDSGGGRVATNHVVQNPLSLLGNGTSSAHQAISRPTPPLYNERVDNGSYHIEDLSSQIQSGQLSNPRIVSNKAEQYLVANNAQGQSVRVSPIQQGDARLASNQVVEIPVNITNSGIVPQNSYVNPNTGQVVGVQGTTQTLQQATVTQTAQQPIQTASGNTATRGVVEQKIQTLTNGQGQSIATDAVIHVIHEVVASGQNDINGNTSVPMPQINSNGSMDFNSFLPSRDVERARENAMRRQRIDNIRKPQGATS